MNDELQFKAELDVFAKEVHHVHVSWTMWRRLFNKCEDDYPSAEALIRAGDEAYRATGATSRLCFLYFRWHVLRGVVLDICRLCDRPKNGGGQANLTVERMLASAARDPKPSALRRAEMYSNHLLSKVRAEHGLRTLRHKVIAHIDLDTALQRVRAPEVPVDEIDLAVRLLVDISHALEQLASPQTTDVQDPSFQADRSVETAWKNEADRLLAVLTRGLAADDVSVERR